MTRRNRSRSHGNDRQPPSGTKLRPRRRRATPVSSATSGRVTALIVGLGASAGGLDAFKAFFTEMPQESGLAFVLVQHLDPQHKSLLVELLSKHTSMPVVQAADGMAPAADRIFVIPPNAVLTIKDGILRVATPAPPREQRRPIDTFFMSLAEDQGEKAVCIILSGSGSDGTLGLKAIKEHGGLTMAQAGVDETALLGMPSSAAATGLVDYVMPVEEMPTKLIDYARHLAQVVSQKAPDGTRADAQAHLMRICALLRTRLGHDFSGYKDKTLIRRIQRRMQVLQIDSVPAYIERLRKEPTELDLLFRDLLIGVTGFFRDPGAFAALREEALPKLLENRGPDNPVRIWVPGCATGEEAYSIAILMKEVIAQQEAAVPVQIFGTDLDDNAVMIARHGRYRKALSGVSPERVERWFVGGGDDYGLRKEIREMCVFSVHSVVKDPPFSKLDLISCRNLMIYLDAGLQDRLAKTFHYALRPGGYLFLGASESLSRHIGLFSLLDRKHRLFQRRDDVAAALPPLVPLGAPVGEPALPAGGATGATRAIRLDQHARRALEAFFPAYMVIDRHYEILQFSGETGRYVEPTPGAASLKLFKILKKELHPAARTALQQAHATRRPVVQDGLIASVDGQSRIVDLIVAQLAEEGDAGLHVVAFQDHGPLGGSEAASGNGNQAAVSVQMLEKELHAARMQLQATMDELGTANEELKSSNEEYQSVNEELQSANEELETSKEELTSINEELQTINSELSGKNEALHRANSDLKNLLDSTQIATLFLDGDLRIKSFTPSMLEIFPVRDSDRGRPITDIVPRLVYDDLKRDVKRVLHTLSLVEREVGNATESATFLMRIRPYRTIDNVIDGVVITFVDITERKRHEEARARLAAIVDSSDDAVLSKDLDGIIVSWNAGAERLFGYVAKEVVGKSITILLPPDRDDEEHEILGRIRRGETIAHYETTRGPKDGTSVEISLTVSPIRDAEGRIIGASTIARDIEERRRAEGLRALMVDELNHRVKNTLATVQSIAAQSLQGSDSDAHHREIFEARLVALSQAHNLLTRENWEGASLLELLLQELEPYRSDGHARFTAEGPTLRLAPKAAVAFAMAFHELATNAAKYGALSTATGEVRVTWDVARGSPSALRLKWVEVGGPPVRPRARKGFGSRLIERGLALELDGHAGLEFEPTGVVCTIEMPLSNRGDGNVRP
jgi:two-component system CheB/CheR fusion protein